MKKIYSFVLMAVALLIGTNAWATVHPVATAQEFETAWQNAASGDVIKVTSNEVALTKMMWLGTQDQEGENGVSRSIEIDLGGHKMTSTAQYAFLLTHGELKVTSNPAGGIIEANFPLRPFKDYSANVFYLTGSNLKKAGYEDGSEFFTRLEIAEGVDIVNNFYDAAITVDNLYGTSCVPMKNYAAATCVPAKPVLSYNTNVYAATATGSNKGVANGVVIDVYGTVTSMKYGVKTNGYLGNMTYYLTNSKSSIRKSGNDYLVKFTDNSRLSGNYVVDSADVKYSPLIHIYRTAKIHGGVDVEVAGKSPVGLYSGGYARWIVNGYVDGNVAICVKNGTMEIIDADVRGLGNAYTTATNSTSSTKATGSGLVMESSNSYIGDMNVTIGGDTKISANNGYAIDEAVNDTVQGSHIDAITINGGTFEGGDVRTAEQKNPKSESYVENPIQGTMHITETTAQDQEATITINGAQVSGTGDDNKIGGQTLEQYLADASTTTHITYVDNGQGGQTMVISEGPAPDDGGGLGNSVIAQNDSVAIKWVQPDATKRDELLEKDLYLKELEITEDYAQSLTIAEGYTLNVGRVILGPNAQIIVKPGANFIVSGAQGIVAPVAANIKVEASSEKQGMFIFNPAVTSNRDPNATVQLYTNCKQLHASPWRYTYQRFSIPMKKGIAAPANNFSGDIEDLFEGNTSFKSYAWQWNGTDWENLSGGWGAIEPFKGYQLANNTKNGGITYTFTGRLVGNGDAEYDFPTGGFDFFGSSHLAPIYIDSLLKPYEGTNMEATVWIYSYNSHQFEAVTSANIKEFPTEFPAEIQPMDGFLLKIHNVTTGKAGMNYASAIWGNPRWDAPLGRDPQITPAPARNRANSASNRAIINVTAENGYADNVTLVEKDQYSAEFDNGADASKFMWEDGINIYATTEAGELANVATDDLKGTLLSFRSGNGTQYTLNMSNVLGEDYALRDNVTGQVITLAEGATYTFMQEANTTVPARFEVIGVAEIPTAIENVEETAKVNGIYTITGQYVGRDFTKLPAGVYVVNGVKIVK